MTGPAGPTGGPAGQWTSLFSDDFDGSTLDGAKWLPHRFDWGPGYYEPFNPDLEGSLFHAQHVSVSGGVVYMAIQPDIQSAGGRDYTHSSGMISTIGRFECEPGDYVEARIWVPAGDGLWPAFWTQNEDQWPPEIDIFEYFGSDGQSRPLFNYHYGLWPNNGQTGPDVYGLAGTDYRDSWHVYGAHRALDGSVTPYLDGVAYTSAAAPAGSDNGMPHFIMVNLSMYRDSTPTPGTTLRVDWVRVWREV